MQVIILSTERGRILGAWATPDVVAPLVEAALLRSITIWHEVTVLPLELVESQAELVRLIQERSQQG
jgi:hypothetical protein